MADNLRPIMAPSITAVDPWLPGNPREGMRYQLLSDDERTEVAKISSIARFKKGEQIFNRGDGAEASFNIVSGVVTIYRPGTRSGEYVNAFLYPGDVFGLSEEGLYSNSAKAITPVTAYRIPVHALRRLLGKSPDLDVAVIIKLCDELRQAQRHSFLLAQRRSITKVAMFLDFQAHLQLSRADNGPEIYLPMDRSAIAEYLALTLAAVSRAFRTLVAKKVISVRDKRHIRILDKAALARIADLTGDGPGFRVQPPS